MKISASGPDDFCNEVRREVGIGQLCDGPGCHRHVPELHIHVEADHPQHGPQKYGACSEACAIALVNDAALVAQEA